MMLTAVERALSFYPFFMGKGRGGWGFKEDFNSYPNSKEGHTDSYHC
jgi:hypothetical protein